MTSKTVIFCSRDLLSYSARLIFMLIETILFVCWFECLVERKYVSNHIIGYAFKTGLITSTANNLEVHSQQFLWLLMNPGGIIVETWCVILSLKVKTCIGEH